RSRGSSRADPVAERGLPVPAGFRTRGLAAVARARAARRGAVRRFDPQPVLKGSLLELRPLRADDQDALFAAASDPLIWEQHPQRNRHEPEVFRGYFAEQLASG